MALYFSPIARVGDDNFKVGSGFKLYFYEAGTSTPKNTFTDNTYATPLANPVVADGNGRFSEIWTTGNYKVTLTDASDVTVWSVDNYTTDAGSSVFAESVTSSAGSAANVITADLPTAPGSLTEALQVVVELEHGANTTATPTFNLNSLGAKDIVKKNDQPLAVGDTGGDGCKIYLSFSENKDAWVLLNPQGNAVNTYTITSSQTYTPKVGTTRIEFEAVGAGGGSGGIDGQGGGTAAVSGAGGGGAYCFLSQTTIESSYTITVGALGAGGSAGANNGTAGGATTIVGDDTATTNMSAGGGAGGTGSLGGAGVIIPSGGTGGTASGGDINVSGGSGEGAYVTGGVVVSVSRGGDSFFAQGNYDLAGTRGAGAGGRSNTGVTDNEAGRNGGNGIVRIREYVGL